MIRIVVAVAMSTLVMISSLAADAKKGVLPDPDSTEGSIRPDGRERDQVCDSTKRHRGPMTPDRRDEVLLRYGLQPGPRLDYEIDHLIPLCLGGSDDFTNLWPQPRSTVEPRWNAEATWRQTPIYRFGGRGRASE
jgi:hypothetical protein